MSLNTSKLLLKFVFCSTLRYSATWICAVANCWEQCTWSGKWNKHFISKAILRYLETKTKHMFFLIVFWNVSKINIIKKKIEFFEDLGTRTGYPWLMDPALYHCAMMHDVAPDPHPNFGQSPILHWGLRTTAILPFGPRGAVWLIQLKNNIFGFRQERLI